MAFQESRAETRFDWFCHRPVASSPNQLTRHPAGLTFVTPKSQFRTCPTDHGKAPSNIAP
ncbi:hypothetical protein F511_16511 [Dorcoceras hygrometricum]|uniref:Uncharacterized protein n=1 Tax=Dorcoceras hygrometricum TaxID=472368 RepID=A0A2Z7CTQ6_9LAMI|nr:hypothetical protein F511_16511 [Dorcoceras hygrometricum]